MAQKYGFFNALESNGIYDRKYNADDYSDNMAAIISTGVRRSGDNDLRVTANGLVLSVAPGRAWINGHWFYSDTAVEIGTVTPPTGTLSRKDGVYLQCDTNLAQRKMQLVYKQGTASSTPTAPACVREGGIYEIMLAWVTVAPAATSVTVTDTRSDASVCGWITSPIGYQDYFANLDAEFEDWFSDVRTELASVTLFKRYIWRGVMASAGDTVAFDIPQYDSTGVDIIEVYVNGLLEVPATDYNLSGSVITFTASKAANTEVTVLCYKSIDGTGLGSVSDEVAALQVAVAGLEDTTSYYYFGTGSGDGAALSTLIQGLRSKTAKITVVGSFDMGSPVSGSGTAGSPYKMLDFGAGEHITVDFYNAEIADVTLSGVSCLISGSGYTVEGLTVSTDGSSTFTAFGTDGAGTFRDCDITLTSSDASNVAYFVKDGMIEDSKITIINKLGDAAVVYLPGANVAKVTGGELYAYSGDSTKDIACVMSGLTASSAGAVLIGVSMPTKDVTGIYQGKAVEFNNGYISAFGIITALAVTVASAATDSVEGTIPL